MIEDMVNKPYGADLVGQSRRFICWHFCRRVYNILALPPLKLQHQSGLTKIAGPMVPCVVLFRAALDWHSGIVWPDGLHFVHACSMNIFEPNPTEYVIKKERLTGWPWKVLTEGFYSNANYKT